MAASTLFVALLRRKCGRLGGSPAPALSRLLSAGGSPSRAPCPEDSPVEPQTDDLKSRVFRLRLPKRSATNALQRWVDEGREVSLSELGNISKDLRRAQRYKHALELMESSRGRAAWSPEMKKMFIDLCLDQVKIGGRRGANLKTSAWKKVREEFNQRNLVNYEQKQFKNYWDMLRKQWNTWKRLISLTGIGEVAPGQTVQMDHERWDEHIKAYPDAKQFRYKPLPHADEMEQLFGGVTATGEHRFGSVDDDHLLDDHISTSHNPTPNTESSSPPLGPEGSGEPKPVQTESNYEERMSDVRRKRPCPSRRRRNNEDTIVDKIDGVLDKIVNSASSQAPIPTNTVPTVDECYASLRETPSFVPGTSLYINALRFINIPENRRLWMLELHPTSRAMLVEAHFSG